MADCYLILGSLLIAVPLLQSYLIALELACLPVSPLQDALSADLIVLLCCRYLGGVYKNLQKFGVSLC